MSESKNAIDDDLIEELIGPVCFIADLHPNNKWPEDLRSLVGFARRVKRLYGMEVVDIKL